MRFVYKFLLYIVLCYMFLRHIIAFTCILAAIVILIRTIMEVTTPNGEIYTIDNLDEETIAAPSLITIEQPKFNLNFFDKNESIFPKMYEIGGIKYNDSLMDSYGQSDDLIEFELEELQENLSNYESEDDDEDPLTIDCQRVYNGYIINSKVFLTTKQWHTITEMDGIFLNCIVCDTFFERQSMIYHIEVKEHLDRMEWYKPLKTYDISIIRKIDHQYHCAVCSTSYPSSQKHTHLGKIHDYNRSQAITKAAEYIYRNDTHVMPSTSINYNLSVNNKFAILNSTDPPSNTKDKDWDTQTDSWNVQNVKSYASVTKNGTVKTVKNDSCNVKTHWYDDEWNVSDDGCDEYIDYWRRESIAKDNTNKENVLVDNYSKKVGTDTKLVDGRNTLKKSKVLMLSSNASNESKEINGLQLEKHTDNSLKKDIKTQKIDRKQSQDNLNLNEDSIDGNVQIIINKKHFVVDMLSYHSILSLGDIRHCFVCSKNMYPENILVHINRGKHKENMSKYHYLDNYSKHLIRKNATKYHCTICNVLISSKEHLISHFDWSIHKELSMQSKTKKNLRKSTKICKISLQKENTLKLQAPKLKVLLHLKIVPSKKHKS